MNGGSISNNDAEFGGGVVNDGSFIMNAGVIANNTADGKMVVVVVVFLSQMELL